MLIYSIVYFLHVLTGVYDKFKLVIQDVKSKSNSSLSFESWFTANVDQGFFNLKLLFSEFTCSYRGQECEELLSLDQILSLGFQAAGGRYDDSVSQHGPGTLEISYIALYNDLYGE